MVRIQRARHALSPKASGFWNTSLSKIVVLLVSLRELVAGYAWIEEVVVAADVFSDLLIFVWAENDVKCIIQ